MRNCRDPVRTQYHATTRPNWCGGCRRVWRAWLRCPWAVVEPGRSIHKQQQRPAQTNFARNFPRSFFETTRKRCNSNSTNSMFEVITGELRAKLLCGRAAAHGHTKQPGPAGGPPPTAQPGPTRQRVERSAEAEQIGRACRQLISSRAIRQQEPPTHRTLMDAE